jgi:tRNA A-37 threonylcarbamoyl transferase component Bud32
LRNWGEIGKQLGSNSVNGAVFSLPNKQYIVKIIPDLNQARREVNIQRLLGEMGIAPRVHNFQTINGQGAIIMNRLGARNGETYVNLTTYMNKYGAISQSNYQMIKNQYNVMRRAGIVHGNLHWGNIAVILNKNGRVKNVKIIDFGRSSRNGSTSKNNEHVARARQSARPNKEFERRRRRAR